MISNYLILSAPHHHNHFTALFPGPPGWAGARRELLDFMMQGEINRGRHTNHPAGRHSIRTNQCPHPPSPIFLQARCPSCRPTNSVKAVKAISYSQHTSVIRFSTNYVLLIMPLSVIYIVSQKTRQWRHLTFGHNFGKCRPILRKILSLSDSHGNYLLSLMEIFVSPQSRF